MNVNLELMKGTKRKLKQKHFVNKRPVKDVSDSLNPKIDRYFHGKGRQKSNCSSSSNDSSANYPNSECKQIDKKFDDDIHELVVYFEKILQTLKSGLPDESRELFVINVLKESKGKEVKLSCNSSSSHCIELLLSFCKDPETWMAFMTAFAEEKVVICTNGNASHITELLINFAAQSIKNWASPSDDMEEISQTSFFLSWIIDFGEFVSENFISCLEDKYASHVACSVIRALGGDMSGDTKFMSKIVMNHKKEFRSQYFDEDVVKSCISISPVSLESIPKLFKEKLKQISKIVRNVENIYDFVINGYCAAVIEALIFVVGKRSSKKCKKLITDLSANLLLQKNDKNVPLAFLHKSCSFVVEKLFQTGDENFQLFFWNEYLADNIEILVQHRVGNYIVQRLFDVVKGKSLLEIMCEKIGVLFDKIIESEHYGIFISIASACNRYKAHQALFMKNIIQCLQCEESEEKQLLLIPLLLNFQKYDTNSFDKNLNDKELTICLQGSLLVQAIFMFQKPIKLVKSLLSMKSQELALLACHIQGCHVLNSFFKSPTVGEKNKDKLIQCLKPVLTSLACDRNGSLTLSRIWVLLSLKQKGAVADILAHNEEELKSSKNGLITFKKFGIFYYKRKYEQWKSMQLQFLQSTNEKSTCK